MTKCIEVKGAQQNNLKKINLNIPLHSFCVICGPSGSGKSSLAFETLFAEGQRRYIETLSHYARQYIKSAPKPLVQSIKNVPPPILLGQRNNIRTSRSTAGTHSKVMDHLRLIFSKAGVIHCPKHKIPLAKYSSDYGAQIIQKKFEKGFLLFPIEKYQHKKNLLIKHLLKDGFTRIGHIKKNQLSIQNLSENPRLSSLFYIVVDRLFFKDIQRTSDSLRQCYRFSLKYNSQFSSGQALLYSSKDEILFLSESPVCPICRFQFPLSVTPALFSSQSPLGACENCKGFGSTLKIDENKITPQPHLTLSEGALKIFSTPATAFERRGLRAFCKEKKIDLHTPWNQLKAKDKRALWKGGGNFCGVLGFFEMLENQKYKMHVRVLLSRYKSQEICEVCRGNRLREEAEWIYFQNKTIHDWSQLTFSEMEKELNSLKLSSGDFSLIREVHTALKRKIEWINQIGLGYLKPSRLTNTLSGGELQRLNLAGQIGMGLSQILYILDEPTIGLHTVDTQKLISILQGLNTLGNTVVVIEHDPDVIQQAQYVVEMGPGSGFQGGKIVFNGDSKEFKKCSNSLTNILLTKSKKKPSLKREIHPLHFKNFLKLKKCHIHNLKKIDAQIPLNRMVVCTGVSGSGKTSLAIHTLYPALKKILNSREDIFKKSSSFNEKNTVFCQNLNLSDSSFFEPFKVQSIEGFEKIKRVIMIDQSPAEKTLRSFIATYSGIYTAIRSIMAEIPLSKQKRLTSGHFSLNVDGGRCPDCRGLGYQEIEMIFMDPIRLQCELCRGLKFQPKILEVKFQNKNIYEILELTIESAMQFFTIYPAIFKPLSILKKVGLGYLSLGQSLSTLSGGESQRLKLSRELSSSHIKETFYILDEPSTGLHFKEVDLLLKVLNQLIDEGGSVLMIEHNLQIISECDYVIDLGPSAGEKGGRIIGQGALKDFTEKNKGATAQCLRKFLNP